MAIYQGADTMEASEAQSIWDVIQGKKRHGKKTLEQHGKRKLFGGASDILEFALGKIPNYGQFMKPIVDIGSKQLEQKLFKMPEYEEEGGSFWASSEIADLKEQDEVFRKDADETLLESIIGAGKSYIGDEDREDFDFSFLLGDEDTDMPRTYGDVSPEFMSQFMKYGGQVPKYKGGGEVEKYAKMFESPKSSVSGLESMSGKKLSKLMAEKLNLALDPSTSSTVEYGGEKHIDRSSITIADIISGFEEGKEIKDKWTPGWDDPEIGGGGIGGSMQRDSEKEKGLMALLQRLLPGGKTGYKD